MAATAEASNCSDWYHPTRTTLCPEQVALLKKLAPSLQGDDLAVLNSILSQFAPCNEEGVSIMSKTKRLLDVVDGLRSLADSLEQVAGLHRRKHSRSPDQDRRSAANRWRH